MRILSIDAWRYDGGWTWNNWFHVGDIDAIPASSRKLMAYMRDEGYLSRGSVGKVSADDDGYNVVVCERSTGRPLFAIEYGEDE